MTFEIHVTYTDHYLRSVLLDSRLDYMHALSIKLYFNVF